MEYLLTNKLDYAFILSINEPSGSSPTGATTHKSDPAASCLWLCRWGISLWLGQRDTLIVKAGYEGRRQRKEEGGNIHMRRILEPVQIFIGTHFNELMNLIDLAKSLADLVECISVLH